jgi:hypothetical protein
LKDPVDIFAALIPVHALDQSCKDMLSCIDPVDAARLVRCVYREFKNDPHAPAALRGFISRVQTSASTPQEWVTQIICVYEWLEQRDLSARFDDVVEYISCAIEGSDLQPGHSIEWYLEQYGFEKGLRR